MGGGESDPPLRNAHGGKITANAPCFFKKETKNASSSCPFPKLLTRFDLDRQGSRMIMNLGHNTSLGSHPSSATP